MRDTNEMQCIEAESNLTESAMLKAIWSKFVEEISIIGVRQKEVDMREI